MELPSLREIKDQFEIKEMIERLSGLGQHITLWQNIDEDRIRFEARLSRIHREYQTLEFEPKRGIFTFNSQKPVYFYAPKKMTILKSQLIFNSNFKISLHMPKIMMAREYRQFERTTFDPFKHKVRVSFSFVGGGQIGRQLFHSHLLDIGGGGMSLKMTRYDYHKFNKGDRVVIHSIEPDGEVNGITATVNYLVKRKHPMSGSDYFRMGLKFPKDVNFEFTE